MSRGPDRDATEEDVLRAAKSIGEPCFTSRELADRLEVSTQTIRSRLESLAEQGLIEQKRAGSGCVYWIRCEAY